MRCRTRKKRCDHAVPTCGECKRSSSRCIQYGMRTSGSFATVPVSYLRQLEAQVAGFQHDSHTGNLAATDVSQFSDHTEGANGEDNYISPFSGNVEAEAEESVPLAAGETTTASVGISCAGVAVDMQPNDPQSSPTEIDQGGGFLDTSRNRHARFGVDTQQGGPTGLGSRPLHQHEGVNLPCPDGEADTLETENTCLYIGEDWMDHYASTYFHHVQPQWSFLDDRAWAITFAAWKKDPSSPNPAHRFIIQLVLAVGALMCSSFRADCPHLLHAFRAHDGAVRRYLGRITQHPSALLRTQASLLLILYAFHSPSSASIPSDLLLVLMSCTNLMNQAEGSDPESKELGKSFERVRRHAIMSSAIINELVSSAWTYPQTFVFEFLDDSVC